MTYVSKNTQTRVGVAGLGFGAAVHIPGFRLLDNVNIVVIAGSDKLKAKRIAGEFGIEGGVGGYQSILDFDVDVVSIALPPKFNFEAATFFLERKIPVICEKPISQNGSQASRLLDLSEGVPNAVNFQFAELNAFKMVKKIIEQQDLGAVNKIKIKWVTQSYANRNKLKNWKRSISESGGVISLLATHVLYLLGWFISPVSILESRLKTDGNEYTGRKWAEDTCTFQAKLESGQDIEAFICNNSQEKTLHEWIFHCENGSLVLKNQTDDYMSGFKVDIHRENSEIVTKYTDAVCESNWDGRIQPFSSLTSRFLKSIEDEQIFHPSFYDAQIVQKCSDALFKSHFNKCSILLS